MQAMQGSCHCARGLDVPETGDNGHRTQTAAQPTMSTFLLHFGKQAIPADHMLSARQDLTLCRWPPPSSVTLSTWPDSALPANFDYHAVNAFSSILIHPVPRSFAASRAFKFPPTPPRQTISNIAVLLELVSMGKFYQPARRRPSADMAEPSGKCASRLQKCLAQLTRLAPAVLVAAIALGKFDSLLSVLSSSSEATVLLDWLQSTCEISKGLLLLLGVAAGLHLARSWLGQQQKVYVVDFAVHRPHDSWRFPRTALRQLCEFGGKFSAEDVDFQERIAYRSGLGDETAVCPAIQSGYDDQLGIEPARFEFGATCIPVIEELLSKAGVKPTQINFVITNSSLFNPTPSLSAAIINHFKMGFNTMSYSLGGMGCSAGVIALDLARQMLELYPNSYALVVSHENITNAYYGGRDRSMLISNCLFRCNGSAVLLSNKPSDAHRAKYFVRNIVRTNMASDDVAYNCVMQTEDMDRVVGVRLNKDLVKVGARALRNNMTALGPKVLPWSELAIFAANSAVRSAAKLSKPLANALPKAWLQPYTPDFKAAFDFFCIHTGGRGIIDGLEKEMQLSRQQIEPSRASLYRFGNTSSTSVWYELAYIESRQGVGHGQRVWQLAFGSGFKFNSAVLVANRRVKDMHKAWEGFDPLVMWADLDKLEAATADGRAEKTKLEGKAADKIIKATL
eukprot:GHRR01018833.1.p1 GENE.GHRR01018833.1~~GHRR01018833.1.p1  ORF type:complete len:680 (+),score=136.37 GHRR01018833.1:887-2926(+)